jgi:hypothetical protein
MVLSKSLASVPADIPWPVTGGGKWQDSKATYYYPNPNHTPPAVSPAFATQGVLKQF